MIFIINSSRKADRQFAMELLGGDGSEESDDWKEATTKVRKDLLLPKNILFYRKNSKNGAISSPNGHLNATRRLTMGIFFPNC